MSKETEIVSLILSMERAALDRWGKGDPSGYLELSSPDVVYFDSAFLIDVSGTAPKYISSETGTGGLFKPIGR